MKYIILVRFFKCGCVLKFSVVCSNMFFQTIKEAIEINEWLNTA